MPLSPDIPVVILGLAALLTAVGGNSGGFDFGSRLVSALLAFLAATCLSVLVSVDLYRSFMISLSVLPATLLFYVIADQFDIGHIRGFCVLCTGMCMAICGALLLAVWGNPHGDPATWVMAAGLPNLLVPNDLILLAVIAPLSFILLSTGSGRAASALSLSALLLSLSVITVFQSRGAFLVMSASLVFVTALLWPKRTVAMAGVIVSGALLVDALQGFSLLAKFLGLWGSRLPLWLAAWHMFLDAPWFGHGPNTFGILGSGYLAALDLPSWIPRDGRHMPWAHSLYLEILAERGLVGAISFGCLIGLAWIRAWKVRKWDRSGAASLYATGVLGSLTAIMLAGVIELSFLRHWFLVMLFAAMAVAQVLSSEQDQGVEQ